MAPNHRKERHYWCRFGRIVCILVLFLLFHGGRDVDCSDREEETTAERGPKDADGMQRPEEPEHSESWKKKEATGELEMLVGEDLQDRDSGQESSRSKYDPGLQDNQQKDKAGEGAQPIHLTYTGMKGTTFFTMVGGPGYDRTIGIPASWIVQGIKDIQEENSRRNRSAWPVLVFENDKVVCTCLAVHDFEKDVIVYDRVWLHPETVNPRRALEELLKEMMDPPPNSRVDYINVKTSPNDSLLIDVLARAGLCLKGYIPDPSGEGMGKYKWSIDLPYLGSYYEHRNKQMEEMGETVYAMEHRLRVSDGRLGYLSTTESEVFDRVVVKSFSTLSPQERYRASMVVLEKAKGSTHPESVVDVVHEGSFCFAGEPPPYTHFLIVQMALIIVSTAETLNLRASTQVKVAVARVFSAAVGVSTGTVFGVLKGHLNDEHMATITFLEASGLHDDYVKARLLTEALAYIGHPELEKVVLKAVRIDDAGTVGLAAELGFQVKASSKDSLLMVKEGCLTAPEDYVVLPRQYQAQYRALKSFKARRKAPVKREYLDIVELARQLDYEAPGFVAKKTQALFLHFGVALLAFGLLIIARAVQQARERQAQRRRVRYANLPDDLHPEEEVAAAVAVAGEDENGVELEAAQHSM